MVQAGAIQLYASSAILDEVRDVLGRPKLVRRFPNLTPDWASEFLADIGNRAISIEATAEDVPAVRDPKDQPYLDLAIAAGVEYLVSRDRDLLDLMNDAGFRQEPPTLTILEPVAFLTEIRRRESEANPGTD